MITQHYHIVFDRLKNMKTRDERFDLIKRARAWGFINEEEQMRLFDAAGIVVLRDSELPY